MATDLDEERAELGAGTSRPTNLVVALLVGTGLALTALLGGVSTGLGATIVAGVALGLAVLCRARDGPQWAAIASALTPLVALVGAAGALFVAAERGAFTAAAPLLALTSAFGLAFGAGTAAFGATGTLGDGLGEGGVRRVWRSAVTTATVVGVAFAAVLVTRFEALSSLPVPRVDVGAVVDPLLSPSDPVFALISLLILVVAAALAGRAALSTLPIAELVSRRRREAVRTEVDRVDATLLSVVKYGVLLTCVSVLTVIPPVRVALPVGVLGTLAATPALRVLLLAVVALTGGIALAGRLLQAAAGDTASALGRLLPAMVGGAGVVGAAFVGAGAIRPLLARLPATVRPVARNLLDALSPTGAVLGGALVALTALTVVLTALGVALVVGLVPTRGGSGALAGAGLALCAVVVGVGGAPALGVFALVGLGVVVWDTSEQGVTARADLGPRSATRIEALHAVGSVGVAGIGVAAAVAAHRLATTVALPDGVLVGAVAAVAGSLLLLAVLRG